jgi:hypothetical protein
MTQLGKTSPRRATASYVCAAFLPQPSAISNPAPVLMNADLARTWRRSAVALAIPGVCLLALSLACIRGAATRAAYDHRVAGVITQVSHTRGGSRPTIEYAVGDHTYEVHTAWNYSKEKFAVGQPVTVLYPPDRPSLGMLDCFSELWPLPIVLVVVSLMVLGLAWKARTGLPPILHAVCSFGLTILGALFGMALFSLLCVQGGLEIFDGAPRLVTFLGGTLIFFATVPCAALGACAAWQSWVPARCPTCPGGIIPKFVGKQLIYDCRSCGRQL